MTQIDFHLQLNHNDNWSMSRLHFHDYCEFLLPLTSPGNIFVNDQVYPLRRGTLYLIGENTLHRTIATGFHARYVLHISRNALFALSTPQTDFGQMARSSFLRADMSNEQMITLVERFQALERNKNDGNFGSDIHQSIALLNLLLQVAPILNTATAGEAIHNKDFLRVAPILNYIRDHLTEPLTLDKIAGKFFLSKHYLCRVFKSATGFSVMEYIIYSRVLRARQLLKEGYSVQQAGELSGFSDNSHFIRTFGHLTGLTRAVRPRAPGRRLRTGFRQRSLRVKLQKKSICAKRGGPTLARSAAFFTVCHSFSWVELGFGGWSGTCPSGPSPAFSRSRRPTSRLIRAYTTEATGTLRSTPSRPNSPPPTVTAASTQIPGRPIEVPTTLG